MDITRLRILTEKSKLNIDSSEYSNITIGALLKKKKTGYLRWVYYHYSSISFVPEVLTKIHVFEQDYISKPGISLEMFEKVNSQLYAKSKKRKVKYTVKPKTKKQKEKTLKKYEKKDKEMYSKNKLQALNHGHKFKYD